MQTSLRTVYYRSPCSNQPTYGWGPMEDRERISSESWLAEAVMILAGSPVS